jgi:hypothetical protein
MTSAQVYASTVREVSITIAGARWRREEALRLALEGAWFMAALTRQAKLPELDTLLAPEKTEEAVADPGLMREAMLSWAARYGLKVEVIPTSQVN